MDNMPFHDDVAVILDQVSCGDSPPWQSSQMHFPDCATLHGMCRTHV